MNDHEIAERAHALPDTFADRLSPADLATVREYAEVGEWGEEIDLLLACLTSGRRSLTAVERMELIELMEAMGMATDAVEALNVGSA
jgi:thioredoxin-like negative regulator of GroEL